MLIVACNKCQAKLKVDPAKIGPSGVKIRCSKCQNVFKVDAQNSVPEAEAPPTPQVIESDSKVPLEDFNPFAQENISAATASVEAAPPPAADFIPAPPEPPPTPQGEVKSVTEKPSKEKLPSLKSKSLKGSSIPKINPLLKASPLSHEHLNLRQRAYRLGICVAIALFGFVLGLTVIGVSPTPTGISLLFSYGVKKVNPGMNLLGFRGKIIETSPLQRVLVLKGHLYNHSSDVQKPPMLSLTVLSPSGEYIGQKTEKCCLADLLPDEPTPFRMEIDLPPGPVGSFDLSLKN